MNDIEWLVMMMICPQIVGDRHDSEWEILIDNILEVSEHAFDMVVGRLTSAKFRNPFLCPILYAHFLDHL